MKIYPSDFFDDKDHNIDPNLCFVIMPYDKPWSNRIYNIISETVEKEGFECNRADDLYGKIILSDIWEQINKAAFVIADLTSNNPNVYYELGVCHTVGKEVIPILQKGHEIPFDHKPFRILFYEDNLDGYNTLRSQIPKWTESLSYLSNPIMLIKQEMVDKFNEWKLRNDNIHFTREVFSKLNLENIDLSDTTLNESDLSKSNLSYADISGSILIRTDLSNSILHDANLRRSNLSESNLQGADLSNSDLTDSILLRANLSDSNLRDANVEGLTIDQNTYDKYDHIFKESVNKSGIVLED